MNARHSRKLLMVVGLAVGLQGMAVADDTSGTQIQNHPWWEFWNQNQINTQLNPQQIQTDQSKLAQDRSTLKDAYQSMTSDRQTLRQDQQQLRQDYQKLRQDQKAGTDVTADKQAIENQRQTFKNDLGTYQSAAQNYQTGRAQYRQDRNTLRQDSGMPPANANPGYGRRGGWDRGNVPGGDYRNRPWPQNDNGNSKYRRPNGRNFHHRGRYDSNFSDNRYGG